MFKKKKLMSKMYGQGHHESINDGLAFYAPLKTSVVPIRGTGSATFTRATTATVVDFEGLVKPVLSGEVRFQGARRVRNLVATQSTTPGDTGWTVRAGTTVTTGETDPVGGTDAALVTVASGDGYIYQVLSFSGARTVSVWLKSGTCSTVYLQLATNVALTITPEWRRYSFTATGTGSDFGFQTAAGTGTYYVYGYQCEDVTGQANQNPSEYVSVGVLSAPYHGAGVDGVKYFDYENGNTVASNVVTEATGPAIPTDGLGIARLPTTSNTAHNYFSTPDSATLDAITGSFDVDVLVSPADWTPGGVQFFCGRDSDANRSWALGIATSGALYAELYDSAGADITSLFAYVSTDSVASTDRTRLWVRMKVVWALTGNITVDFYTSQDGVAWTALGTQRTAAATGNALGISNALLTVGARQYASNEQNVEGSIYRMRLYNGDRDTGTLVADFNPTDWTTGSTFTSSQTGEEWTLNGGAVVTKSVPGYLSEQASTNNLSKVQEFDHADWTKSAVTVSANVAVAPDGTTTADKLEETAVSDLHYVNQLPTTTATRWTVSCYLKAAERSFGWLYGNNSATATAFFNLATGTTATVSGTGNPVASITACGNGWYRCVLTYDAPAGVSGSGVGCSNADNTLTYLGVLGSGIYVWGFQLEALSFATSYIPTTTAAVTRNADVLTYPGAGNFDPAVGAHYCEYRLLGNTVAYKVIFDITAPGAIVNYVGNNSTVRDGTTVLTASAASAIDTNYKQAFSWGGSRMAVSLDGAAVDSSAFDGSLGGSTTLYIGADVNSGNQLNGTVRQLKLWTRALSDVELVVLTR